MSPDIVILAVFWIGLVVSVYVGYAFFRDLGDVSQAILKPKRSRILRFIRHEYWILSAGLIGGAAMVLTHFAFDVGPSWVFWTAIGVLVFLYGFTWVWVHIGFRNQRKSAKYYPLEEATARLNPISPVAVIEREGKARAHPHTQIMRPHLAGNEQGLDGWNVVMTYCGMANLSLGYIPQADGKPVDLQVLAQHGNNLVLRDNKTNEPIQHIYGKLGGSCNLGASLTPWPTFRMSLRGFAKAFPDGVVFLNKPSGNPLYRFVDLVMDYILTAGIAKQHIEAPPLIDNMEHYDDRLPTKTYVWGVNIGDDATCFTQDFVVEQGSLINCKVGGRDLVVYFDAVFESLGVYYNDTGAPIEKIDFFGNTDHGKMPRVELLKPGLFWHVWANFFPHTDINRTS